MSQGRRPVRLLPVPPSGFNPYITLLYRHLSSAGVEVLGGSGYFRRRLTGPAPDFVHYHWPEKEYNCPQGYRLFHRSAVFFSKLSAYRASGAKIVWTMHNDLPHDRAFEGLQKRLRKRMVSMSDIILVNFEGARQHLRDVYGRTGHVYHVPHGSYRGYYRDDLGRDAARRRLGIEGASFSYLLFGDLRRYKNIPGAIRAFGRLEDPRLRLVIAGRALDRKYARYLEGLAAADRRIVIVADRIADDDVQVYFKAADVLLLTRDVFSSGTAVLAMDFGLPVLAPPVNHVREVARDEALIPLQRTDDDGVADGLSRALTWDLAAARHAALASSDALAWPPIARRLAGMLERYKTTSRAPLP